MKGWKTARLEKLTKKLINQEQLYFYKKHKIQPMSLKGILKWIIIKLA